MNKKVLATILSFLMIAALITGCQGSSAPTSSIASAVPASSTSSEPAPSSTPSEPAANAVTVKWATILPPDHPFGVAYTKIAADVKEKSGGKINIEVYPSSQLGGEPELVNNCKLGIVDVVSIGPTELSKRISDFLVFDCPFMFADKEHFQKFIALDSPVGGEIYQKLEDQEQMRVIMSIYNGARQLTTKNFPVNSVSDLTGKKIRCPNAQGSIDMVEQVFKAQATPMNLAEVYLALQNGTVDGQENPVSNIYSNKFYEVQQYINMTSHVQSAGLVLMSMKTIEKIGQENYDLIMEAVRAEQADLDQMVTEFETEKLAEMQSAGMEIVEPTDLKSFSDNAAVLIQKYESEGQWTTGMYEKIQALI